jgi:hypothetical protein
MVVRSRDGSVLSYPVVETIHKVMGAGGGGSLVGQGSVCVCLVGGREVGGFFVLWSAGVP